MTTAHREGRNLVCLAVALWLMGTAVLCTAFGDAEDVKALKRKAAAWWRK